MIQNAINDGPFQVRRFKTRNLTTPYQYRSPGQSQICARDTVEIICPPSNLQRLLPPAQMFRAVAQDVLRVPTRGSEETFHVSAAAYYCCQPKFAFLSCARPKKKTSPWPLSSMQRKRIVSGWTLATLFLMKSTLWSVRLLVLSFWMAGGLAVSADVGDPQLRTDHPFYPGELACSTFERLFASQAVRAGRETDLRLGRHGR